MNNSLKILITTLVVIAICGIAVFSFLFFNGLSGIRLNPQYKDGHIKVALVGDSVTYGHSVKNWPKNNYPALLSDMLGDGYCVKSYGVSGSTVQPDGDQPYNITKAYTWSHEFDADILIFMLGSNDSKPQNWKGAEKFKEEYIKLLNSYITAEKPLKVFICTPPTAYFPEGKTEGLSNYDVQPLIIEDIADIVRDVAKENNYDIIEINNITENRRDLFGKDNVHPNIAGAKAIADEVYKYITNMAGA